MTAPVSLGNALAWAAQAALIAGAVLLLPRLLGLRQPRLLLPVGQAVLLAVLLLPLVQPRRAAVAAGALFVTSWMEEAAAAAPASLGLPWRAAGWLLAGATAVRLGWMGVGLLWLGRLRRAALPLAVAPAGWPELCAEIGVVPPMLLVSDRVPGPVGFGLRRPVVVLPPSFERAAPAVQRAVLCHEALHARRRDWAATVGEEAVRALLWFHPVVGLLVARIRLWREQVVDRAAVALSGDRRGYLEALVQAAGAAHRLPRPLPAASFLHRNDLGQRLALLVEEKSMNRKRLVASTAALALGLLAAGALSIALVPLRAEAGEAAGEVVKPRVIEKVNPEYPSELRKEKVEGVVVLRAAIDEHGVVTDAEVDESPHRAFSQAAREAVRQWRFEPGTVAGRPAPTELTITINFRTE